MDSNEEEAPPPPYSEVDPMRSQELNHGVSVDSNHEETQSLNVDTPPLEADFSALHIHAPSLSPSSATPVGRTTSSSETGILSDSPLTAPSASAGGYFVERSQPVSATGDTKLETLIHHMTIYARSQGKEFPRRPRCWNARASEINQHDWDTFLNFLFPPHLGPAASSNRLHPQIRAEIGRDRKDRAQETDEQRSARITEVITEWNEQFFTPRGVHITWTYVGDLEEGPASSLCPNCYPQATDASRTRDRLAENAPIPVYTLTTRRNTIQRRPLPQYAQVSPLMPQNIHASPTIPPVHASTAPAGLGQTQDVPSTTFKNRDQTSASGRSNPMSWATQMSSIAQQYAAKITNQAQEYGRSIEESALARSRQMELYSKRIEENALARARQFETLAMTQGRRVENTGDRLANWTSGMGRRGINAYQAARQPPSTTMNEPGYGQRSARRLSTASDTSITSVSSIDTVSSVSDLEPGDLASVREQLSALDEYHHHELYAAAVSLRSQLKGLKKARWHSRRHSRRAGPWGRWESPAEATDREQRRIAMKRETKLLREKFTEIERRAKREVREMKKSRKETRWRQWQEQHRARDSSWSHQHHRPFPDRSVSDRGSNLYKEILVQSPSSPSESSLNRTTSAPAYQPNDSTSNTPAPTSPQASPLDPHEAAKAWTEAQRTKAREIKRANKERIKEIQKAYKEREKQERKAIKKLTKQKHGGLTMKMSSGGSFASSSSLTLPELGTIRSNSTGTTRSGIEGFDDDVATDAFSRENSDVGGRRSEGGFYRESGVTEYVAEPEVMELDGSPIDPRRE